MQYITKYFPNLTSQQQEQFTALGQLYPEWNAKINVISRRDINNLYLHHVLHSLAITRIASFKPGASIMDLGTGGGFPGIPLAIYYPEVRFHLVDSIRKKLIVASSVAEAIGLKNVTVSHARGEEIHGRNYDFVVTRAVMPMPDLVKCIGKNISTQQRHALPNGIIALKGGDLTEEIKPMRALCTEWNISDYFDDPFFETKKVLHAIIHTQTK